MKKNKSTKIKDVMTKSPRTLSADASLTEAARIMRDDAIGGVIVTKDDGSACGFLTDRDIVVRALAEHRDPDSTRLSEICSSDMVELQPEQTIDEAVRLMAEHAIRRIPVVDGGRPVGLVSLGDLAQARDPDSALGAISSAPPNR
jgi:signal-transduction protein with cAMP-binding, CBS, and nucleotidyltransferase domain